MEARLLVYIVLVICPHFIVADQSKPLHANDKEEERWLHADECFSKAVERVEMRCKEMTEGAELGVTVCESGGRWHIYRWIGRCMWS